MILKWKKADLEKYLQEKKYIDTLLVPLLPVSFSNDAELVNLAYKTELLTTLTNELERELAGRLLQTPPYHYLESIDRSKEIERINEWIMDACKQPFQHTFIVTHDMSWKKNEQALEGILLWIPTLTSVDPQADEYKTFIRSQVEQMVEFIRSYW